MKRTIRARLMAAGMGDPSSPAEWEQAVDAAQFLLLVDAGRQYGLLTGGPKIDVERCQAILDRGEAQGILPAPTEELVEKFIKTTPRNTISEGIEASRARSGPKTGRQPHPTRPGGL